MSVLKHFQFYLQNASESGPTNPMKRESESELTSDSEQKSSIGPNLRASASTLNFDAQSVQTASSTNAPRAKRPTRGSFVKLEAQSNVTSSTFYNRP